MAQRLHAMGTRGYEHGFRLTLMPERLSEPLDRHKPTVYFVNSMSDLFHENVPFEYIRRVFDVMSAAPQHTFQVLTKRPERMLAYMTEGWHVRVQQGIYDEIHERGHKWPTALLDTALRRSNTCAALLAQFHQIENLHLGVSVEDQATAEERIPLLLQTPAAVRFVSAEPLLGGVNLRDLPRPAPRVGKFDALLAFTLDGRWSSHLDWVICGGESGPGARPMHPDWARGLRDQCVAAGVPFFFKQWGEWAQWDQLPGDLHAILSPEGDVRPEDLVRVGKKAAGSLLDGREWKEFPR
jgi:protein gp37